jgi:hypothetical protein
MICRKRENDKANMVKTGKSIGWKRTGTAIMENGIEASQNLKIELLHGVAISFLDTCSKEMKSV